MIETLEKINMISKNMNNILNNNKLLEDTKKEMIKILDNQYYIFNMENICEIINKLGDVNLIDILYNKTIKYYSENHDWSDYESCIRHLIQYYRMFSLPLNHTDSFFRRLAYAIHMAGDGYNNYPLKAAKGISQIKDNIAFLKEEDLLMLLNFLEQQADDEMRSKQLTTVIEYSVLQDIEFKKKLKAFYIDRWGIERYIVKKVKRIFRKNLNDEYIELEINEYEIALDGTELPIIKAIKQNNKDEYIYFGKKYLGYNGMEFFVKKDDKYIKILSVNLDYQHQFINIEYDWNKQLNLRIDNQITKDELEENEIIGTLLNQEIKKALLENSIEVEELLLPNVEFSIKYEASRKALREANNLIGDGKFQESVDRVHTAFHGYLKSVCKILGEKYKEEYQQVFLSKLDLKDVEINKLFKFIDKVLAKEGIEEELRSILKAMATQIHQINTIRNHKSMAHPNEKLLSEDESIVVLGSVKIIMLYVHNKIKTMLDNVKN